MSCPASQTSICSQLVGRLAAFGPDIKAANEAVAELDCILRRVGLYGGGVNGAAWSEWVDVERGQRRAAHNA